MEFDETHLATAGSIFWRRALAPGILPAIGTVQGIGCPNGGSSIVKDDIFGRNCAIIRLVGYEERSVFSALIPWRYFAPSKCASKAGTGLKR